MPLAGPRYRFALGDKPSTTLRDAAVMTGGSVDVMMFTIPHAPLLWSRRLSARTRPMQDFMRGSLSLRL
jgi:hypothetical protein